jgi:predicted dehydrogenase
MGKIRIGIIGLGYIGKVHLRNCLKLPFVTLEAVSDVSKQSLNDAKASGVKKTFSNYEQLLRDPQIDAVIVALPTHLHSDCAIRAAEAKKHIMLEKPIARNTAEANEIVSSARQNSVKLMMAYPFRFSNIMCNLKRQIESGELGDVVMAVANNVSTGPFMHRAHGYSPIPVPEWWWKKELTGGGALIDLGSHVINLLRWFFGEITCIKSHLGYRFNLEFEDQAYCIGRFESGTTGVINTGYFTQKYQFKVELLGTADLAIANNAVPNPIRAAIQMLSTSSSSFWQPYLSELEHFVSRIAKDEQPYPSGVDGLRDLEAIEAAYRNLIQLD